MFKNCLLTGFLIAALLTGTSFAWADDVVVGFAVAKSGWLQAYDAEAVNMAKLWIDEQNAKGGLLGRHIRYIEGDTKTDRVEAARVGRALVEQGVDLLVTSADYDYGAPAAIQAQKAEKISVFVSASDAKAGVLGVGNLSFTTTTSGQLEGATIAQWAAQKRQWKQGYLLLDDSIEYDKSVCAGYEWEMKRSGGTLAGSDVFKNDDPSLSAQITRLQQTIRQQHVDHIMLCSHNPGAASAIRQIRAAGIQLPVLNGSGMDGTYWTGSVPNLSNFYVPVQVVVSGDPSPNVNALTDRYKIKYGQVPSSQYAYPIYAWLQLWAQAVEKVHTFDAQKVVDEMNTFRDRQTVLGPRSFTQKLHIQNTAALTITEFTKGNQTPVGDWRLNDVIPDSVLYRTSKN